MKPQPFFTIVDRYFMRKFLFVAFALLFIATSIFMIFDILPKAEDVNTLFKESAPGALKTIFQYYTVRMMNLLLYTQFAFLASITAITFFMLEKNSSATVRGGEIIPVLTSGFSRKRVAIPFFIIGCVFDFALCLTEECFYANCRDWAGANSASYEKKVEVQEMDMRNDEATSLKIYGSNLDRGTGTFLNAKIGVPRQRTFEQMDEIQAQSAQWLPATDEHPTGYLLRGIENLEQKSWLIRASRTPVELPAFETKLPVFFTAATASWVKEGELFFVSSLNPTKLAKKKAGFLPRSLPDLYRDVNEAVKTDPNHAARIALHTRIMRPFVECLLLFLMIPVILSARLRSKVTIFFCLAALTGLDVGLVEVGRLFVLQEGIPAGVGAWIPILILTPVSALLFDELYT